MCLGQGNAMYTVGDKSVVRRIDTSYLQGLIT